MLWYRRILNWWLRPVQIKYSEWPLLIIILNYFIKTWVFNYWTDNTISWVVSAITTFAIILPLFALYLLIKPKYRLTFLFLTIVVLDIVYIINYYFWSIGLGYISFRLFPWIEKVIEVRGLNSLINFTTPFFLSSSAILITILLFFRPQKISRSWVKKIEKKKQYPIGYFFRIGSFRLSGLCWTIFVSIFLISTMFYKQFIFKGEYFLLSKRVDDSIVVSRMGLLGYQFYDVIFRLFKHDKQNIFSSTDINLEDNQEHTHRESLLIITIPELNFLTTKLTIDNKPIMPYLHSLKSSTISFENYFPSSSLDFQSELALLSGTVAKRPNGTDVTLDKYLNSENTWTVLDSPSFLSRKYWSLSFQFNSINFNPINSLPSQDQVKSSLDSYLADFNSSAGKIDKSSLNIISLPLISPIANSSIQSLNLSIDDQIALDLAQQYDQLIAHIVNNLDFQSPISLIITANNPGNTKSLVNNSLILESKLAFNWDSPLFTRYLNQDNFINSGLYQKLLFERLPLYIYSPKLIGSQIDSAVSNANFGNLLMKLFSEDFKIDTLRTALNTETLVQRHNETNNPELIIGNNLVYVNNFNGKLLSGNNCYDLVTFYSIPDRNCYSLIDKAKRKLAVP